MSKPYVYKLIHIHTGQYYFGYRCNNVLSPLEDLPKYQSSSKVIKKIGFENFFFGIIEETTSAEEAYDLEQTLIKQHWGDSKLLNHHYIDISSGKKRFKCNGHTEETKIVLRAKRKTQTFSKETRQKISNGCKGKPKSDEHRKKLAELNRARFKNGIGQETRDKISKALKGRPKSEEFKRRVSETLKSKNKRVF